MGKSVFDYNDGDFIFSTSSLVISHFVMLSSDDDAFRRQHGAGSGFRRTAHSFFVGERRITCFHIKVSAASKGAADTLIFFLRTSFAVCYVQVTDFPPAGKALQGTDVLR